MARLQWLTLVSVVLSALVFCFGEKKPTTIAAGDGLVVPKAWLKVNPNPMTPEQYRRPPDQTFLTFPEWFLVFSPEEQANYFKNHTATTFPYLAHTAQIWESYHIVNEQIKDNFVYNGGYHFMIWVIGTSASVEYAMKSGYEILVGRITDTNKPVTEEDRFNALFTHDYVDFIKVRPWYEFDFKSKLTDLWKIPVFGNHPIRKLERRYLLTSELLVKYVYGKLIGLGTAGVYEQALPTTEVIIDRLPENTKLTIVKTFPDGVLVSLPRYDQFAAVATDLAVKDVRFEEIAGNTSAVLVTAIVPESSGFHLQKAQVVFTQPLASATGLERIAFAVPVVDLGVALKTLEQRNVKIEHVFDY